MSRRVKSRTKPLILAKRKLIWVILRAGLKVKDDWARTDQILVLAGGRCSLRSLLLFAPEKHSHIQNQDQQSCTSTLNTLKMKIWNTKAIFAIALTFAVAASLPGASATGMDQRTFEKAADDLEWDLVREGLKSKYVKIDFNNYHVLRRAAGDGQWDIVHRFLRPHDLRHMSDEAKSDILEWACYYGDLNTVKHIVGSRINPFTRSETNENALIWAAAGNSEHRHEILGLMLKHPLISDADVQDALEVAIRRGHEDARLLLEEWLLEHGQGN